MNKSVDELTIELKALQEKYSALETKYNEEITACRKNEEELRMKLMFLEGVANSAIDGFLVVNPRGQKILQNRRTIELWKIPQDVAADPSGIKQVNHVMNMTVNPQQFVAEINYQREHPNEITHDELELTDGTILDRYSSPVIGDDGLNYGRIYTFHDITERKKLEAQLIQLNADKDRFISILAHDLRSPFNTLLGFIEMLRRKVREYPIEKTEKILESIYTSAAKTYELLEDTLLWANIQTQKITYSPTVLNVTNVISEVEGIMRPNALVKNIKISYSCEKELMINADIYMLKAILRNLISNAIKFTNDGGKIDIMATRRESEILFTISDNGVGIKAEVLEKLFNFTLIKSSKGTANETGTGLGLLLCKEFVDKHCGKIWVDSKENLGTTVYFTIPEGI